MLANGLLRPVAMFVFCALFGCGADMTDGAPESQAAPYDLLIKDGVIVDGTGAAAFEGDVAIKKGLIAAIGNLEESGANEIIDASGLVVAPGFIDVHSHADLSLDDPATAGMEGFLKQGVTTAVYGVDGYMGLDKLKRYIALSGAHSMGMNFMSYVGHNAVRSAVMGNENRKPTPDELEAMKAQVDKGMQLGALGLSTGLMYLPGSYADKDEIIELAKSAAPYGGRYDSHIRDPANNLLASIAECLDIARAAGVDAHPAHLKAVGAKNFGKGADIISLIEGRVAAGEPITVDVYPYDGAATAPVTALLYPGNDYEGQRLASRLADMMAGDAADPEEMARLATDLSVYWTDLNAVSPVYKQAIENTETPPDGVFSWVAVVGYQSMRIVESRNLDYVGRMVVDLAGELEISPFELFRKLVVEEGAGAMVTLGAIQEDEVRALLQQPWTMISSDGVETAPEHPRGRGTFPRVLGRYVREWGILSLEEAVHKMSGLPAQYLKLTDRGVIKEGSVADIVVFDPAQIIDRATWSEPGLYANGVKHVLIGGEFALRDGELSDARLGKFIPFTEIEVNE